MASEDKTVPPLPTEGDSPVVVEAVPAAEADQMIDPAQLESTVVVTNIKMADKEATQAALAKALPDGISIVSTISQVEGAYQHVVLILDSPASAERVCGMPAVDIMGTPGCKFIRAKNLNVPQEQNAVVKRKASNKIKAAAVGMTASAIILGGSLLSKVKKVDDETGISRKVNESWETGKKKVVEIDAQLGISAGVRTGATATVNAGTSIFPSAIL